MSDRDNGAANASISDRLAAFRSAMGVGEAPVVIAIHDFPDPDALASAFGLQHLLAEWNVPSVLSFEEGFGRPENKRMAAELDIRWQCFHDLDPWVEYRGVILADTQPEARNHSLPAELPILAVFDHHPLPVVDPNAAPRHPSLRMTLRTSPSSRAVHLAKPGDASSSAASPSGTRTAEPLFRDVRPQLGASSTLILEYLAEAGIALDPRLATALFLGIATDTDDLLRGGVEEDRAAYARLLPLVDLSIVGLVRRPPLSAAYFDLLSATLRRAVRHGGALVADVGAIDAPDLLSLMSELLIRADGARWALCLGRLSDGTAALSMRLASGEMHAGRLMRATLDGLGSGGGHAQSAGGQIPVGDEPVDRAIGEAVARFLWIVGAANDAPHPLTVPPPS